MLTKVIVRNIPELCANITHLWELCDVTYGGINLEIQDVCNPECFGDAVHSNEDIVATYRRLLPVLFEPDLSMRISDWNEPGPGIRLRLDVITDLWDTDKLIVIPIDSPVWDGETQEREHPVWNDAQQVINWVGEDSGEVLWQQDVPCLDIRFASRGTCLAEEM